MKASIPGIVLALALAGLSTPAAASHRRPPPPPTGTIVVENHTGVPVMVSVEGEGARIVAARESARFTARDGTVDVRATYRQYGSTFTLTQRRVQVRAHRSTEVDLRAPSQGQVQIVNTTGRESRVIVNGRTTATLDVGTSRILTVPLGRNEITVVANGRVVESEWVDVRPFSDETLVARAPSFADLVVSNPLPFPVDVRVGHGAKRRIASESSVSFANVPVGETDVESWRVEGYILDHERVDVRAWTGGRVVVDTPRTGLVRVDSDLGQALRVFVDGRAVTVLEPYADTTLLLPVGPAVIEVRGRDGRLIERDSVAVNPLRPTQVEFERGGSDDHRRHPDDRSDNQHASRDSNHHMPATW